MGRRRASDPDLHGVLVVDKPAGPTSHDVVGWIRWALGVRRVGHCGTLDPGATGLLVVGVGSATKLAPYLTGQDKRYQARFVLGASTTTDDADGAVVERRACPPELSSRVPEAVQALVGDHALPPPAYSAVHVEGRRAHELARAGQAPSLPARPMIVYAVEPGPVRDRDAEVDVEATLSVSKGTYIRSLAVWLGQRVGVPAHLAALHRVGSGTLDLTHPLAVGGLSALPREPGPGGQPRWRIEGPPEAPDRAALAEYLRARLLSPAEAVPLPVWRATDDDSGRRALSRLANGQPVTLSETGLAGPGDGEAPPTDGSLVAVAPASALAPGLIIARVEGPGPIAQLKPQRVVVGPAVQPLTAPQGLHHSPRSNEQEP